MEENETCNISQKNSVMKKIFIVFYSLFVLLGCKNEDKSNDFPDHPRIILNKGAEKELLKEMITNNTLSALNDVLLEAADDMIPLKPVERIQTGRRILSISRICLKRVLWLSYSYRISGNKKYLLRAEKEMLAAASFTDWNPSHFLDVAEMTTALAIGYDWLYHDLSESSKVLIREAIINKGLKASNIEKYSNKKWLNEVNNWNQVCNGGMVLGALAIYETDSLLANEIINRAKESIKLPLSAYEPDGAYPEGPSYWQYGTTYNVLLISAAKAIWGENSKLFEGDGFMKSGEYNLHAMGDQGFFNYSDNSTRNSLSPALFWYAAQQEDNSLIWNQKPLIENIVNGGFKLEADGQSDRFFPLTMVWGARIPDLSFIKPTVNSWTGKGKNPVGLHRSSWDKDAIFIGIKGGTVAISHSHMDMGSFVMDADGVRWAIDLGGHPYHKLEAQGLNIWKRTQDAERWDIFRYTNQAHNTLSVNGQLIKVDEKAEIIKHSDKEEFKFSVVDLSPVYKDQLQSAVRGIALIKNSYVIVKDEIVNSDTPSNLRWAMVIPDSIDILEPTKAIIHKNGKLLHFRIIKPKNAKIKTYSTDPPNDFEDKNLGTKMIGLELNLKPNESTEIEILLVPGSKEMPNDDDLDLAKLDKWR